MCITVTDEAPNGDNGKPSPEKLNTPGAPDKTKETITNEDINEDQKGNF